MRTQAIAAAQSTVAQEKNDGSARAWMLKALAKLDPAGAKAFAARFVKDESIHVAGTAESMTKE